MKSGTSSVLARYPAERKFDYQSQLKHCVKPSLHAVKNYEYSYPSPPMSNPSSPSQPPSDIPVTLATDQSSSSPTDVTPTLSPMSSLAISLPAAPVPFSFSHPGHPPVLPPLTTAPHHVTTSQFFPGTFRVHQPAVTHHGHRHSIDDRPAPSHGGRKPKAHVASACINCKRAHLSCDVNRPCGRCVATGKQDTCFDVQHKKRGRPRLRDENRPDPERSLPDVSSAPPVSAGALEPSTRQIVVNRTRRADSFQSIGTKASDYSGDSTSISPTHAHPPHSTSPTTYVGFQQAPAPYVGGADQEIPTAYLDLDLVVMKANQSYRRIMLGGREVVGRHISDMVAPADEERFENIQARLRSEREERDPYHMPPIIPSGSNPVQGAALVDVEHFAQGFKVRNYVWSCTLAGSPGQKVTARVRLAKAGAYYVAVTLHNVGPPDPLTSYRSQSPRLLQAPFTPAAGPAHMPDPPRPLAQPTMQPPAISTYVSRQPPPSSTAPDPGSSSSSTAWSHRHPQPSLGYQQMPSPGYRPASSGPLRLPAITSSSVLSQETAIPSRELPRLGTTPPIQAFSPAVGPTPNPERMAATTPVARPPSEAGTRRSSASEDQTHGSGEPRAQSPAKRRRLNIHDVLS